MLLTTLSSPVERFFGQRSGHRLDLSTWRGCTPCWLYLERIISTRLLSGFGIAGLHFAQTRSQTRRGTWYVSMNDRTLQNRQMGEIAPRFSGRAGRVQWVGLTLYRLYLGSIAVPRAPRAAARGARANRAVVRRPPEARHFQLLLTSTPASVGPSSRTSRASCPSSVETLE